jgi:DDE superfamily endonuclease
MSWRSTPAPTTSVIPQVCLDEKSKQLVGEVREPLAVCPGRPARYDYEYEREGTANLFIVSEPLAGWRHISVTERRTKLDWAHCVKELVDVHYPEAEKIVLVLDNLNTHTPAALYEAFVPAEARRIARKLEIHYTPKHGSWLNMAEISSRCSLASVWISASPTKKRLPRKWGRGKPSATRPRAP